MMFTMDTGELQSGCHINLRINFHDVHLCDSECLINSDLLLVK